MADASQEREKYVLDKINPKYSIISVGKNNRYNHPNKETLNKLEKSKSIEQIKMEVLHLKLKTTS